MEKNEKRENVSRGSGKKLAETPPICLGCKFSEESCPTYGKPTEYCFKAEKEGDLVGA